MMMNLFSSFDPTSTLNMNWLSILNTVILFPIMFWLCPSRINLNIFMLYKYINSELKNNLSLHNQKMIILLFSMFWFILINNMLGLFSYNFTATSHLSLNLILTLPLWLTFMLYGWTKLTMNMFIHLVPNGTPMALSFFMVMIETTSNLIRPITLSVRLTANMIAGHLLLTLLSNISESISSMYLVTSLALTCLIFIEFAVAIIQSYVFVTLLSLYMTEIN